MIDEYLDELSVRLTCRGRQRVRVLEEVRDHLADAVRDLEAAGIGVRAEREAVRAFGHPADLARQFNARVATTTMRRTPLVMSACGIAGVAGFLFAATTQPRSSVSASAGLLLQFAFFVAVLGVQFAMVAGARAASRVAALWRSNEARDADRVLVRRCAVTCVSGLAVATAGWTVALAIASRHLPHVRVATMIAGVVLMVGAACAAVAVLRRHPAAEIGDESANATGALSVILGAGERVIGLVRRWPAPACAVVGFVLLGPRLGLRTSASARGESPITSRDV
jgi:hypothetical protein